MNGATYYRLAPGVDGVPLSNNALLFRSTTLAVKVDGSMATVLRERLLPLLQEGSALADLQSSLADVPADDVKASLDSLVDARVVVRSAETINLGQDHPFAAFVSELGVDPKLARE